MPSIYTPDPTNPLQPADTDYAYLQAAEMRALKQYLQTQLGVLGGPINMSLLQHKNLVINGDFFFSRYNAKNDFAGTPAIVDNTYYFDRWVGRAEVSGAYSCPAFVAGQTDVPDAPARHCRITKSVAGSASTDYTYISQRIENVGISFGRTFTLSFYAKADASKNLSVEFVQNFGTGGTPTAEVTGIGVSVASKFALTTSWQKFTLTFAAPAAPGGLVLGTDDNSYFGLNFWMSAGSNYAARTQTLGAQTGTFDISHVQLEYGGGATIWDNRSLAEEEMLCARYLPSFQGLGSATKGGFPVIGMGSAVSATSARIHIPFKVPTRAAVTAASIGGSSIATFSVYNGAGTGVAATALGTLQLASRDGVLQNFTVASGLTAGQGTPLTAGINNVLYFTGAEL